MKTIEERAKEYSDRHKSIENSYFRGYNYNYNVVEEYDAEKFAYEAGAYDQKAIDEAEWLKDDEANYQQGYHDAIEKACKWLEGYCCEIGCKYDCNFDDIMVDGPKRFRKAMEK